MSKLICNAIRCVEETNEIGNDDVYMVVFRGSFNHPPDIKVIGGKNTAWGNMHSGKNVSQDMLLYDSYLPQDAYVTILMEQDANRDILTGNMAQAIAFWAMNWTKGDKETIARLALVLGGGFSDDEMLGTATIPPIFVEGGPGHLITFVGDGGIYRTRFVKRA